MPMPDWSNKPDCIGPKANISIRYLHILSQSQMFQLQLQWIVDAPCLCLSVVLPCCEALPQLPYLNGSTEQVPALLGPISALLGCAN